MYLSGHEALDYVIDDARRYHGMSPTHLTNMTLLGWHGADPTTTARNANLPKRLDGISGVLFASDLDRPSGLNGAVVSGQEAADGIMNALLARGPIRTCRSNRE
jgi:oxygen-dependent protoporphyrinogen oxidase